MQRLTVSQVERDKTKQFIAESETAIEKDWHRLSEMSEEERGFIINFAQVVAGMKKTLQEVELQL